MSTVELPSSLNIADRFLDARIREGKGEKTALITGNGKLTYAEVHALANRMACVLRDLGVDPEQRVLIGLPDIPAFVAALFGTLKNGAVVVMVNNQLKADEIAYFYEYTRAKVAIVHESNAAPFLEAASNARDLRALLIVGGVPDSALTTPASASNESSASSASSASRTSRVAVVSLDQRLAEASDRFETYPTHRDDPAIWLFSGGTTGRPKAVIQTHASFANTTDLYGHGVLAVAESDVTLSVPKLYFGYATGINLFFPFSVGAASILFPDRCTADALFDQIQKHRPTILVNVPTMVNQMVSHPAAQAQDLSCLRLATSAGEALPVELYERWMSLFGVELLDGLGTAEMWHIFLSNRPGDVRPGTLGKVVPGFDVRVRDDEGRDLPDGEVGWLWVRGGSRAIGYWHHMEQTQRAFQGEWYVSGDMVRRDADETFTYCGRGDDMLKVGGKWLAPSEVENCLLQHPLVKECAVVGVVDENGLTKPHAFVVSVEGERVSGLEEDLRAFVREKLEAYKAPRRVEILEVLPRTHLGKVDRGALRRS